jgi:hypothetical protein
MLMMAKQGRFPPVIIETIEVPAHQYQMIPFYEPFYEDVYGQVSLFA